MVYSYDPEAEVQIGLAAAQTSLSSSVSLPLGSIGSVYQLVQDFHHNPWYWLRRVIVSLVLPACEAVSMFVFPARVSRST